MGASGWFYRTPYDADLDAALQRLRREVFERGEYYQCWLHGAGVDPEMFPPEFFSPVELERLLRSDPPADMAEALMRSLPDGTHSVLDVTTMASEPGCQLVTPLAADSLRELFGTERPSASEVEARKDELWERVVTWSGCSVVAYEDQEPAALYFFGVSGD